MHITDIVISREQKRQQTEHEIKISYINDETEK